MTSLLIQEVQRGLLQGFIALNAIFGVGAIAVQNELLSGVARIVLS